jgi:hypothetical protein
VAKVNLPLPDPRLRLFIQGKEDWLEEGLLVPTRKNKRGRIVEEGSSSAQAGGAQPNYVKDRLGVQRGGASEWEPIKILLERD